MNRRQAVEVSDLFRGDVDGGVWTLVPASERLLWEVYDGLRNAIKIPVDLL
jgi:hypothetical protein